MDGLVVFILFSPSCWKRIWGQRIIPGLGCMMTDVQSSLLLFSSNMKLLCAMGGVGIGVVDVGFES